MCLKKTLLSVALLATVIIWLQDFNSKGLLNMTPDERELAHKSLLSPMATSINEDFHENDEQSGRETRNKYLNRPETGDDGHSSDTEPLLQ